MINFKYILLHTKHRNDREWLHQGTVMSRPTSVYNVGLSLTVEICVVTCLVQTGATDDMIPSIIDIITTAKQSSYCYGIFSKYGCIHSLVSHTMFSFFLPFGTGFPCQFVRLMTTPTNVVTMAKVISIENLLVAFSIRLMAKSFHSAFPEHYIY